ncbi:MAG: TolC family protein [Planctomycetota bacterium]
MKLRTALIVISSTVVLGSVGCQSKPLRLVDAVADGPSVMKQSRDRSDRDDGIATAIVSTSGSPIESAAESLTAVPKNSPVRLVSTGGAEGGTPAVVSGRTDSEELPSPLMSLQQAGDSVNGLPEPATAFVTLPDDFYDLSLCEVVEFALTDQRILRSLSGTVINNPASVLSSFDPDIQRSDANFGIDAAKSQFDPLVSSRSNYANNDDFFNNPSTTGNAAEVQQDLTELSLGLDKVGEYGTRFSLNPGITHDNSNNPSVFFPNAWESVFEATIQQPLLQGRGRRFNRIAGPNSRPGFFGTSGIEISRIDNAIEYSRFQRGLQEYVLEVVNAYWQLDLAYKNFHTIRKVRDASYETWQAAKAKYENGLPGGEADSEAQSRAQYYEFEIQLDKALNAVQAGQTPGVLQAEANLRRLMNLPPLDGSLIRPADAPSDFPPEYDWSRMMDEALAYRPEIQQQRRRVTKANLLAEAAKNFTLPRLDAVATYRLSGLGDDLIADGGKFAGALNETFDTNYEEVEIGISYEAPVGRRLARAGLRNARLQSARERLVLEEMEQQVIHELGKSYRAVNQLTRTIELARMRRDASRDTFLARTATYNADAVGLEDLLQAQRFYLDAELSLQSALTEREQALCQLSSEQGKLLHDFTIVVSQ